MYDNKELMHRFAKVARMADGRRPHHHGPESHEGPHHGPHHGPEGQCCRRPAGPEADRPGRGPRGPMSPMRGQGRILAVLTERDGVTTRELVEVLDVRPSSLNESLGRLEARGLVERRQSQADGRQVEVRITDVGRELARTIEERDPSKMFDCLTDEEREQLGALLDKVIASTREARGHGRHGHGCHGHGPEGGAPEGRGGCCCHGRGRGDGPEGGEPAEGPRTDAE